MPGKRIAIIGAGCSGLTAIKSCVEEGLEPVCFERSHDIGGLWRYTDTPFDGQPSIYKSLTINTSKEMMAFSDFPVPAHFPPFMPHKMVLEYFEMYAKKFDLKKHINFQTEVGWVTPAPDYELTGRWNVSYKRANANDDDIATTETFDGVMLCSGHHTMAHIPKFPGASEFQGEIIHSREYKTPAQYADKNVLVVGIGNSAVDIAVDTSHVANQVSISTRRGAWVISRMGFFGLPNDAVANSRFCFNLPEKALGWTVEKMADFRFRHEDYGLKPTHGPLNVHPTVNDELPLRIMQGKVACKPDIQKFTKEGVVFTDGTSQKVDAVVMATGYTYSYKYVDPAAFKVIENDTDLYKFTFLPEMRHPSLALVGLAQPVGAIMPISELQARWYTRVMTGQSKLPTRSAMCESMKQRREVLESQYIDTRRHHLQAFYVPLMDELAEEVGCRPNLKKLAVRDPVLAARCYFGPCVPAQYRLEGPRTWDGATDVINNCFSNFFAGTKVKPSQESVQQNKASGITLFRMLSLLFIVLLLKYIFGVAF